MEFPKSEFWDFTLSIYGNKGFSPAVIAPSARGMVAKSVADASVSVFDLEPRVARER